MSHSSMLDPPARASAEQIVRAHRARRRHRSRLRRAAARGRVRARRLHDDRHRPRPRARSTRSARARRTSPTCRPRRSRALVSDGRLRATTDFAVVAELDTINICVPTPLRKTKDPDMSYIVSAVEADCDAPASGDARHPRVDDLSGHDRGTGAADARGRRAEGRRRLLPRVLARSASTRATRRSTRTTCRRSSAVSDPTSTELAADALRRGDRDASCRSARRRSPRWSSCSRTRSGR